MSDDSERPRSYSIRGGPLEQGCCLFGRCSNRFLMSQARYATERRAQTVVQNYHAAGLKHFSMTLSVSTLAQLRPYSSPPAKESLQAIPSHD